MHTDLSAAYLRRRHLNESQRAMVAAKLANMRQGERTDVETFANLQKVSQAQAAEFLNVAPRTVASAKRVAEDATPELVQAVERGAVSVSAAAEVAALPTPEPIEIVARGKREILHTAKEIRAARVWPA
jgi:hypothetical protein